MPMEFRKKFNKCIVIIDCFEVFMERPKGLMARAQTWSNYKHHNTVKILIRYIFTRLNYIMYQRVGVVMCQISI